MGKGMTQKGIDSLFRKTLSKKEPAKKTPRQFLMALQECNTLAEIKELTRNTPREVIFSCVNEEFMFLTYMEQLGFSSFSHTVLERLMKARTASGRRGGIV